MNKGPLEFALKAHPSRKVASNKPDNGALLIGHKQPSLRHGMLWVQGPGKVAADPRMYLAENSLGINAIRVILRRRHSRSLHFGHPVNIPFDRRSNHHKSDSLTPNELT